MRWNDTDRRFRVLAGALAGGCPILLLCAAINRGAGDAVAPPIPWPPLGMGAAILLALCIGASIGLSTLPFAGTGRELAKRSAFHFLLTGVLVVALGRVCGWYEAPVGGAFLFGLYAFFYLLIWLTRYAGWRVELSQIRSRLGLAPPASPLRLRGSLPYLLVLGGIFLALRPLAEVADDPTVPLLRAMFLPWLCYPVTALVVGFMSGLRVGLCPLLPLTAFVSFLPALLFSHVPYDWPMGLAYAALALVGNLSGGAIRRARAGLRGEKEEK